MTENPLRLECKNCGLVSTPPEKNILGYVCPNCHDMDFRSNREIPICDFCCTPGEPVVASFPAKDFGVPMPTKNGMVFLGANSIGWWAACQTCRDLVAKGDRDALAERSTDSFVAQGNTDLPRERLLESVRNLHDQFWENREGEAIDHGEVPSWPVR